MMTLAIIVIDINTQKVQIMTNKIYRTLHTTVKLKPLKYNSRTRG